MTTINPMCAMMIYAIFSLIDDDTANFHTKKETIIVPLNVLNSPIKVHNGHINLGEV